MALVSGPLKIMTDKPSRVSEVWVGSPRTRPHGGGLLVEERDKVTPVGGALSFTSVPGPVLLTLVSGGRVVDSVKGIVPDKASATLAEVVRAVGLADAGTLNALEELAVQVAADAARVGTAAQVGVWADQASGAASDAAEAASDASGSAATAATAANSTPGRVTTEINTQLPPKIDQLVPPKVAEVIGSDTIIRDAAAAAVAPLAQGAVDNAIDTRLDEAQWWKGNVGSQHLDTLVTNGRYSQFQTSLATLDKGYPVPVRGLIDVARQSTANASQTYATTSAIVPPQVFLRSTTNAHEPAPVWTEWAPFFTSQSDEESAVYTGSIGRSVRESEMRRKTGRVTTGGKAAIALIFDHGTDKFRDIVLPALQARGLAGTLALNADRLEPGYVHKWSESVPWATVAQWAANGIEIANHSLDHLGADTPEETYRQIVHGRELLESYVGQDVYSWVHHGTQTRGDYDGFGTANRDYLWSDKLAGQLILSSHVATTGNIVQKDYTFPLDGTVPIGGRGVWIDQKQQTADAYGMLDKVIELGGRMMFRCHPMYIDHQDQFLTTQEFLNFLDYVKSKVDAGSVVSLTMREWSIAERGEEDKADLATLDTRIPETLALRRDTSVGTRIMAGATMVSGKIPMRNITGFFSGALTGGTISVARTDNLMHFSFAYANIADNTQITMSLPVGWRPIATTTAKLHAANGDEVGEIYISWAGSLIFKKFSGPSVNDTAIFMCETWPTILPGTPA